MREILISIQPKWVEKILNGEKTIEIRKTKPSCELPCKVYIYCTKSNKYYLNRKDCRLCYLENKDILGISDTVRKLTHNLDGFYERLNGYVVTEFTLNEVEIISTIKEKKNGTSYQYHIVSEDILNKSCLKQEEILDYTNGKDLYAWHIDNLKIYDKPKELSEFNKSYPIKCGGHEVIDCYGCPSLSICNNRKITRPPQSWCYIEKVEE